MREVKVVIIDDEAPARLLLRNYIAQHPHLRIVGECKNGVEAIGIINVLQPDLAFLDVQMPGKTGFEVLQELEYFPRLIFSTAYDQYALQAFNVNAVDYLLKPYTQERFEQALEKALQGSGAKQVQELAESLAPHHYPERILVEQSNRLIGIAVADILWLEAEGDYTKIHTSQNSFLSNKGISELEQRLNPMQFQRVHRSAIIALGAIKEVFREPTGPQIILTNQVRLKVSRSYIEAFRKLIY
jgi:two-component system LytT family response regulator